MGTAVTPNPGTRRTQATSTPTPSTRQQPSQSTSRQQTDQGNVTFVVAQGRCTVTGPSLNRIEAILREMRTGGDGGDPYPAGIGGGTGGGTGTGTQAQVKRRKPMSQAAREKLRQAALARAAARKSQQAPEGHTEAVGAKGTRKPKAAAATG